MSDHTQIVKMANDISNFFRYQGSDEESMKSIASHINHFWAPPMRRDLVTWLDAHDGEGMNPLVRAAVERYRDELVQRDAKVPGEQKLEQPKGGGDAG